MTATQSAGPQAAEADPATLTVYESTLWINPLAGRWSPGRGWMSQPYRVHQRLSMAFPSDERKERDRDGIKPYSRADFEKPHDDGKGYGVPRADGGFLFRIEGGAEPRVRVRSVIEPDWVYAFQNAPELLRDAKPFETTPRTYEFVKDDRFPFRLLANPTRGWTEPHPDGGFKKDGKKPREKRRRHALRDESGQWEWLLRKAEEAGFSIDGDAVAVTVLGDVRCGDKRWFGVRFEGTLTVFDPAKFVAAVRDGLGSGKAFGFGLLSLAPPPEEPGPAG